ATTTGEDGTVSGTQVAPTVDAPVSVARNAFGIVGDAVSTTAPAAPAPAAPAPAAPAPAPAEPAPAAPAPTTSGADGLASGTQVVPDVSAPVDVTGNAVGVVGDAVAAPAPAPAAPVPAPAAPAPAPAAPVASSPTTSGEDGVLSGTQVAGAVDVPVTATGNAVGVLGDAAATSSRSGSSSAPAAPAGDTTTASTSGEDGVLSGTQVLPDVTVPVTVSGNGIGVLGDGSATGTSAAPAAPTGGTTSGSTSGS
ncbi:chaplin family protein, partial [Curtobacterium sp. MCPF17_046]|uniref:chaplin family protein n=1 Tax=Curtobacterium sp. MCPF17_046 TaxID=2175663 RepID=UPI000D99A5E4